MNQTKKTATQYMQDLLNQFRLLMQLPPVEPEYIAAIQLELRRQGWKLSDFRKALDFLKGDPQYAEQAGFSKYPTISDFMRAKKQSKSKGFYSALARYLSGDYWEKETIDAIATPEQKNAIILAGGLERLYDRASGDNPTPIYKLLEIVQQNESETPSQLIDATRRLSGPSTIGRILLTN